MSGIFEGRIGTVSRNSRCLQRRGRALKQMNPRPGALHMVPVQFPQCFKEERSCRTAVVSSLLQKDNQVERVAQMGEELMTTQPKGVFLSFLTACRSDQRDGIIS